MALAVAGLMTAAPLQASAEIIGDGRHHQILNRQDPVCLDVEGARTFNGSEVKVFTCVAAANQMWLREETPRGTLLRVMHTGKCLSVQGGGRGSNVVQDACGEATTWRISDFGNGWSRITTGGLCLDKAGWDVTVWDCHDGRWQQWQSLG